MSDPGKANLENRWDEARALRALWDRSAYDQGFVTNPFAGDAAAGLGLRRTAALLEHLGSPQTAYPIIHIAGSKGKGSTSAIAAAILRASGVRVGLHTSPHLHDFRERFIVDGRMIDPEAFGGSAAFLGETEWLAAACRDNPPVPGGDAVRLPGQRGLERKRLALAEGVALYPGIISALEPYAKKCGATPPRSISGPNPGY